MTEADFSITVEGQSILVKLRGDIDMDTAPRLTECLSTIRGHVWVDCAGLDFLDSSGIQAFIRAHRAFEARGDRLILRDVPAPIRRVFDIVGVTDVLNIE